MENERTGNVFFQILKGVGTALAISFLGVIILASVLLYAPMQTTTVYIVNQCIKILALAVGVLIFVRGEKGFLQGMAIAALFTALSFLAFSAVGGDFSLSWLILVDILLGLIVGAFGGIAAVNLKRG